MGTISLISRGNFLIKFCKKDIIGLIFLITMNPESEKIDTIDAIDQAINEYSFLIRAAIRKTSSQIDESQMDDIEQEVKIKIWKEILKSEKKILNLGSYIWKVTYTTTCRIMRDLSAERKMAVSQSEVARNIEETAANGRDQSPEHHLEIKELIEIIKKSVDSLMGSRRAVIKLYLLGMDHMEISEYFGWSEGKVRNLISRGLEDLRKTLRHKGL